MQKLTLFILMAMIALGMNSCKKEAKVEPAKEALESFSVDENASSIVWTAYKTSEKVPVKGTFKKVSATSPDDAATREAVLNGLKFEIPVSSIFTNDSIRDGKLQKFFFEVMDNTASLKGQMTTTDSGKGELSLEMNGLSKQLPFEYTMAQDTIIVNAVMDLNNWQAQAALSSLNEACRVLHSGSDGVPKTWSDVNLLAKIVTVK